MKILGIRNAPTTVRYAVVDWDGTAATLVNATDENKLSFPAGLNSFEQKLHWLHQELSRVLRQQPGIERIAVKTSEFGRGRQSSASREAAYMDAVALLLAGENGLPAVTKPPANCP